MTNLKHKYNEINKTFLFIIICFHESSQDKLSIFFDNRLLDGPKNVKMTNVQMCKYTDGFHEYIYHQSVSHL
jgi:hypothetical protein